MARCLITRELPGGASDRLAGAGHEVEVRRERMPPTHEQLLQLAPRFDALLTLLTDPVDAKVLAASPELRAIANYAVGTDNIDLDAATARGIPVGNTPDVLTETTADLAVALMLALMRRLREGEEEVRAGEWLTWEPARLLGRDLHGATVLVVGAGRIGRAVARRLDGFGCRVLTAGRGDSLDPLLGEADVITLHCPLTPRTTGLIGSQQLAAMKPTAYLVNTARGPIVDAEALLPALHDGQIAGAALDVTDPEPLPSDHPLTRAPGLLVVPHIASATHATREAMADMAVDNLLAALAGERMPHCANPEVYEP
ncbi:MAG: D-glycerate dehydrogenase [Thermoleophilaceae bacterium]|nr:D-glycerate dehydrogenase [Thermoleophilaceae bacterium]